MGGVMDQPVYVEEKGRDHQGNRCSVKDFTAVFFLNHIHQFPLDALPGDEISLVVIGLLFTGTAKAIGKIRGYPAEPLVKVLTDPKYEPAVWDLPGMKNRAMGNAGRDQQIVAIMKGIGGIPDLIAGITF